MTVKTYEMLEDYTTAPLVVADDEKTAVDMASAIVFRFNEGITLLKLESVKKVHSVWVKEE